MGRHKTYRNPVPMRTHNTVRSERWEFQQAFRLEIAARKSLRAGFSGSLHSWRPAKRRPTDANEPVIRVAVPVWRMERERSSKCSSRHSFPGLKVRASSIREPLCPCPVRTANSLHAVNFRRAMQTIKPPRPRSTTVPGSGTASGEA